ncbi:hypothetical protein B0H13DRAFT_2671127 [Mycena leptocephala]|nr:hypothetical protein B0H13DRAFT_2671127 [Mycena leptocephala]
MKSVTSRSAARSSRFSPHTTPLPKRPSAMTLRNGARLRAARLARHAMLDDWLAENIAPRSLFWPDRRLLFNEAVCMVFLTIVKGPDDGVFQDPDIYCLSLLIELRGSSASPLLRIGRFVGSNDDADAPLWTRIVHPGKSHYFVQPRTFAAALVCGMTDIKVESMFEGNITSRMCLWARTASLGTWVEEDVTAHCQQLADAAKCTETRE